MPCLRVRVLSRCCSIAAISVSMSERMVAISICSGKGGNFTRKALHILVCDLIDSCTNVVANLALNIVSLECVQNETPMLSPIDSSRSVSMLRTKKANNAVLGGAFGAGLCWHCNDR